MADFLIYGLGRSGRGVASFLAREGVAAEWVDARPAPEDERLAQDLGVPQGDVSRAYRTVVAAPGVPIDHPDLAALRARGAEVIGELELAYRRRNVPIIGVTGTAGKGGTSVLIQQLLTHLGVNAHLGGNFDPPLLDVIDDAEVAVCEISSFQLERVQAFRPAVGVITNLGVDHLDRHGSVEAYHAAKKNLAVRMTPEDTLVLPEGVEVPSAARVVRFDAARLVNLDGEVVLTSADVPDGHHPGNVAAALLAVDAYLRSCGRTVAAREWAEAVHAAKPVPGRFETVARVKGVAFVEDSIATRTIAVQAALSRAEAPVAWLVGGIDKGADLAALEPLVQAKVARIVAFGQDGPAFAGYFDARCGVPVTLVPGADAARVMADAVHAAYASLPAAGTVLLAPIGTSFDLWKDYKARGASFTEAARALATEVRA